MSAQERASKCSVHMGHCHQHLRNVIIGGMEKAATSYLQSELEEDLSEFSSFDRMSVDCCDLLRAVYKEIHASGKYAKGKGCEFEAWRKKHYPNALWIPVVRVEGTRQDIAFDGAMPIYMGRKIIIQFLMHVMAESTGKQHDNVLENFLMHVLQCNEMTAMLRAFTLFKLCLLYTSPSPRDGW